MRLFPDGSTATIRAGLAALGIQRFTLAIHDASFPSRPDEDIGRGSPYGHGARGLFELASGLGLDSIQLGPQGDTSAVNPSPYDGALFSKAPLSIALATLTEDPRWEALGRGLLPAIVARRPNGPGTRVQYGYAWAASKQLLSELHARFLAVDGSAGRELAARAGDFRARWGATLAADGAYEALTAEHGSDDWRRWPSDHDGRLDDKRRAALSARHGTEIDRHLFGQFVLDQQHQALRARASSLSLALFGDLQIGFSHRDVWSRRGVFRADYVMGAPPSRTNPSGQAWGYPVLDLERALDDALALLTARADRMMADFDGLRVDHPHGLVCPWVYDASDPAPAAAVMKGARLRCSPNLVEHPALAALAIPDVEQLSGDPGIARYADDWVRELRDDQVDRYGVLFDAVIDRLRAAGRRADDVVCEVLSTWPYPLRRVMARYGLGRFCVTQKADLGRADDVYRGDNASPQDWIMVGNHDTPPIWNLAAAWHGTAAGAERALVLAGRLAPRPELRPRYARWLAADPRHLCHGMFAELFIGPARRVSVFFADLCGLNDIYNRPGIVHPDNWLLRLPADFADRYTAATARAAAFNVPLALALALASKTRSSAPALDPALTRAMLHLARRQTTAVDPEIWSLLDAALALDRAGPSP